MKILLLSGLGDNDSDLCVYSEAGSLGTNIPSHVHEYEAQQK